MTKPKPIPRYDDPKAFVLLLKELMKRHPETWETHVEWCFETYLSPNVDSDLILAAIRAGGPVDAMSYDEDYFSRSDDTGTGCDECGTNARFVIEGNVFRYDPLWSIDFIDHEQGAIPERLCWKCLSKIKNR
jgi:hypothetical protein